MFKELSNKLNNFLQENYSEFVNYPFNKDLYVLGGTIRDVMLDKKPKDVDFLFFDNEAEMFKFLDDTKIKYALNSFGTPKIDYNGKMVDMMSKQNPYNLLMYNVDGLFYNCTKSKFMLLGFENFAETRSLKLLYGDSGHPNPARTLERQVKLRKFTRELKERHLFEEIENSFVTENDMFEENPFYIDKGLLDENQDIASDLDIDSLDNDMVE